MLDDLIPLVYDELRARAGAHFRRLPPGHTLEPTGLVHEALLKITAGRQLEWKSQSQLIAFSAKAMREIIADHARRKFALKRGGAGKRVTLKGIPIARDVDGIDVLDLDEAMRRLAELSSRQARIVELRFFGGLTVDETADVLGIGRRTVLYEWRAARAWLRSELANATGA